MSRVFDLLQKVEEERGLQAGWEAPRLGTGLPEAPPLPQAPGRILTEAHPGNMVEWQRVIAILKRNWKLSVMVGGGLFLAVVLATFLQKPLYEPESKIEIDPPGEEMFSLHGDMVNTGDTEYVETQVQSLRGDDLALEVIRDLHLDRDPEFADPEDIAASVNAPVAAKAPAGVVTPTDAENDALGTYQKRLIIKRDPNGRLVNISFGSHDPQKAAVITNTLIDHFIEKNFRIRNEAISHSSEWLAKQLDDIKTRMDKSNQDLADFQRASGITDVDQQQSTVEQNVQGLNQQYTQAQVDRIQFQSYLEAIKSGNADSLPQVRDNQMIQAMVEKLSEAKGELAQAMATYGKNNPNAKKLQQQVDALEEQLAAQKRAIYDSIGTSYEAAVKREGMLAGELKGTVKETSAMAKYNDLKKQAQTNTELYNTLYAQIKQAGISAASKSSNVSIVDRARVLDLPTHPKKSLNLAVGFIAALFAGVLTAFVRAGLDPSIRSLEDVKMVTGLRNIATLPATNGASLKGRPAPRMLAGGTVIAPNGLQKFLLESPLSPQAEAIRNLHASITLGQAGAKRVFMICSAAAEEGKTTLAVNLAISLARHSPTCLIDADLRRPSVGKAFGISCEHGLGDVLTGAASLPAALLEIAEIPNLSVLPTNALPTEALQFVDTFPFDELLRDLRAQFKYIVVDTSPLVPFADSRAVAPLVDGLVLVGRYGVTNRSAISRCVELLGEINSAPIVQFVMNGADAHHAEYGYYA